MQFDQKEKGFSFMKEGPLDMRMDPAIPLTAEEIVNHYSEESLADLIREMGEERYWRRCAKAIVKERKKGAIKSTTQLAGVIEEAIPRKEKRIHPATRVFQALRIAVNKELENLEKAMIKALEMLAPKGRLGVISFHSLEDRIVKGVFKSASKPIRDVRGKTVDLAKYREVTKKPLVPSRNEIRLNRRSRSAKFRVIERI